MFRPTTPSRARTPSRTPLTPRSAKHAIEIADAMEGLIEQYSYDGEHISLAGFGELVLSTSLLEVRQLCACNWQWL